MGNPWVAHEKWMKWIPVVDFAQCDGCRKCVWACERGCIEIMDGVAVVTNPSACAGKEHCVVTCPQKTIDMEWVECFGDHNVGRWL